MKHITPDKKEKDVPDFAAAVIVTRIEECTQAAIVGVYAYGFGSNGASYNKEKHYSQSKVEIS